MVVLTTDEVAEMTKQPKGDPLKVFRKLEKNGALENFRAPFVSVLGGHTKGGRGAPPHFVRIPKKLTKRDPSKLFRKQILTPRNFSKAPLAQL